MLYLSLVLLRNSRPKPFLIILKILQTSLNGFYRFLMQTQMRKNHTFVNKSRRDRFVSLLEILVQQTLLYLQSHL